MVESCRPAFENGSVVIMMEASFVPTLRGSDPVTVLSEPYFKAEIEATDQDNIYYIPTQDMTRSAGCNKKSQWGFNWIGFSEKNTTSSGTLSDTISLDESGYYRIFVVGRKTWGKFNPEFTFTLNSTLIETVDMTSKVARPVWFDMGRHQLNSGDNTFSIGWSSKNTWFESIIFRRVDLYQTDDLRTSSALDASKATYTKNTIAELNVGELDIAFKEDFYKPDNPHSRLVFDVLDVTTFWVGESRRTARPEFGGYLTDYTINSDGTELKLKFGDRLLDLFRRPVYKNYSVGISATKKDKPFFGHQNFNNIFQLVEHMTEANMIPLQNSVGASYAFKLDMGDYDDFSSISTTGYAKKQDGNLGNPAPGLMLYYEDTNLGGCAENATVNCSATLYSNLGDPADAADFEILAFDYIASGEATVTPLRFNVLVTMYRADENYSDAVTYMITFNSPYKTGKVIGNVNPQFNGEFNTFEFNLKTAFDKVANSSHYYVTQIQLVDRIDVNMYGFKKRAMHLDNFGMFGTRASVKTHVDMESKYPLDVIRDVAETSNYDGYVLYGNERRGDTLIFAESGGAPAIVEAKQGVNVLGISNMTGKLNVGSTTAGFANSALRHYHYKSGKKTKTGSAYYINMDSYLRYGPFENYKDMTGTNTRASAEKDARLYVENNCYTTMGFTLDILGTVLINPSDYLVTDLPQRFLSGNHSIKSMDNSIDLINESFESSIDLNLPSKRFKYAINAIKRQVLGYSSADARSMYSQNSLSNMGFASPGAFIQRRKY